MNKTMKKLPILLRYPFLLFILINFSFPILTEEYSIRRKKPAPTTVSKKSQNTPKKETESPSPQFGYSRDNNKLANQFWLEEGAIFNPDYLNDLKSTEETVETIPEKVETPKIESTVPKPVQEEVQTNKVEKSKPNAPNQPNPVLHFLSDNKKILLIISLIIIFAIYRLRGDTSSRTNQNTRIFSKFRNK
jgi:hypothetical protein